ncbi:MAG: hypothetical protein ACI8P3_004422 [Saprospiraceae bacterium]|jgi:hypothetical protein
MFFDNQEKQFLSSTKKQLDCLLSTGYKGRRLRI